MHILRKAVKFISLYCTKDFHNAYKKYKSYANSLDEPDWDLHIDDPHENCTRIMTKSEFKEMIISNDIFYNKWVKN